MRKAQLRDAEDYYNQIKDFPVLSVEETSSMFLKLRNGDPDARETLINCNLRYAYERAVKKCHMRMTNRYDIHDVIQQANEGLIKAVDSYDVNSGVYFLYYAKFWIDKCIDGVRYANAVCPSASMKIVKRVYKYRTLINSLDGVGEKYTQEDLCNYLGVSIKQLHELDCIAEVTKPSVSGDTDYTDDASISSSLMDTVSDSDAYESVHEEDWCRDARYKIGECLGILSSRDRSIFVRHALGETLQSIADDLSITRQRVAQIYSNAVKKMATSPVCAGAKNLLYCI